MTRARLPYGSWPTPVTSELVVADAVRLSEARVDGDSIVWAEGRPSEGGRTQLVRRSADGSTIELLADGANARTAVHEYGGGAWWVRDGVTWYVEWADQRLYRIGDGPGDAGVAPVALTPEPAVPRGDRWADGDVHPDGGRMACVREHHPSGGRGAADVVNEVVQLSAVEPSTPEVLVTGPDFVSSPRWSADGRRLCWIEWDHPDMPWDSTRLQVRDLSTGEQAPVAGGPGESVTQPAWQPDGSLWFISDRPGWWNLYRWDPASGSVSSVVEVEADIGMPDWVFGLSRYAGLAEGEVAFARWSGGLDGLAIRLADGSVLDLDVPFTSISTVRAAGARDLVVVGATTLAESGVYRLTIDPASPTSDPVVAVRVERAPRDLGLDPATVSEPERITFPSAEGRLAHGLLYSPANAGFSGPEGELPPLLVVIHGGPTSAARPELQVGIQFWTSRGFTVVDVNYRGSTGYGRSYRDLLKGSWGVVDVEDCMAAARWLAEQGHVDPERLCIRGGSAGGYTTLAVLSRADTPFAAGADHYGVADLEALATDTHKFESRYLDGIVGPYPQARDVYVERSPIHHVERFERPLIVLQGLQDEVVPPNQSEMIVDALRSKGVPVAYVTFEGEQHGFRRAANIRRALDSELSFYSQVLGFDLPEAEGIEPVPVDPPPGPA